ncbi:MAG: protein-L-isoaspartate O-methyltransferase [Gammaproteobacteria bacterium]
MDMEQARFNMIEQQIRTWEVLDTAVLELLGRIPREDFVPAKYRMLAFADLQIPLGHGHVMMAPKMEGRVIQALGIKPDDAVLEVGTGSGYLTALLASLAKHVYSVDILPEFKAQAQQKLAALGLSNVTLETGDAALGWERHGPYDVIAVTGAFPLYPEYYERSLRINGRMFVIVGRAPAMEALLVTRVGEADWMRESLFEADIPTLINAPQPQPFVF